MYKALITYNNNINFLFYIRTILYIVLCSLYIKINKIDSNIFMSIPIKIIYLSTIFFIHMYFFTHTYTCMIWTYISVHMCTYLYLNCKKWYKNLIDDNKYTVIVKMKILHWVQSYNANEIVRCIFTINNIKNFLGKLVLIYMNTLYFRPFSLLIQIIRSILYLLVDQM